MRETDQKIIQAIIQKAERICPDALELIAVYGSVATGDLHSKSDLDLLLLIKDDSGRKLADGFLLEDTGVGYDLYCTTWQMLENDAQCHHPHLSKLLDASLLHMHNPDALSRWEELKEQALRRLASDERFPKAQVALDEAKKLYADVCLCDSLSRARAFAGGVLYFVLNAVMLFHGQYFRKGVKRTFEEITALALPFDLEGKIRKVILSDELPAIREALTDLLRTVQAHCTPPSQKEPPTKANLAGTYEEMVSNWRNKMGEAAERQDVFASFMNLVSLQCMLDDIAADVGIAPIDAFDGYSPTDLQKNQRAFDAALESYRKECEKIGLAPKVFANVEEFVARYLGDY